MSFKLLHSPKQQTTFFTFWIVFVSMSCWIHQELFELAGIKTNTFTYSLVSLYLLFGLLSIGVLITILQVRKRNFDSVGMSFMVATSLKIMVCFLFVRPILKSISVTASIEKINFFTLFIVFLAIETSITILILNEKQ